MASSSGDKGNGGTLIVWLCSWSQLFERIELAQLSKPI
ncbi:hypothetical protein CASFOL_006524 [Castilleja foliolosa]|uniref:Uncharacterized protein n=1 Tax=Castilleja foliolosa TaxID=1961234 RepID=A0ABD3E6P1_9LAMI